MPIQIGQRPDHGFDEPLGLLSDCHRRIEHFLRVLVAVDAQAAGGPLDPDARRALEGALTYFAVAAPRHTADEEASLFPRLRQSGDRDAARALALLDALERDHEAADVDHAVVDTIVRRWLEADALTSEEQTDLRARLDRLVALYERHIQIEDTELFPAAARVLTTAEIRDVGREMASRRQIVSPVTVTRRP
jgi:hemerythrin-like domain-containing protein